MKVMLRARAETEKQKNEIYEVMGLIAEKEHLQIEERQDRVIVKACPQGTLECWEQGGEIRIHADTTLGGPGFHACCVRILEWLAEECETPCTLSDDCGYVEHGDFGKLKYEHFYPWLLDLKRMLLEEDLRTKNYYFDHSDYLPHVREDVVATPMGFLDRHELEAMDEESLARCFFIWNDEERDAEYYRSCALHLLAKESYGPYAPMNEMSEKYAAEIADYVEIAHAKDPQLALPYNEYQMICQALHREAAFADAEQMDEEIVQYRLHEVYHLFHEWRIYAPGCCERSYDASNDELYLMAPYAQAHEMWKWMWKISAHGDLAEGQDVQRWENDTVKGSCQVTAMEDHTLLSAVLRHGKEKLSIQIYVRDPDDLPYLQACLKQCERHEGSAQQSYQA